MKTTKRKPHLPPEDDTLIRLNELPGPLGLSALSRMGILTALDDSTMYLSAQALSIPGRAAIAQTMVPLGATACTTLALWVWLGGTFPPNIQIVSHSHYRELVHSRRIVVRDRRLNDRDIARLGQLWVTTPARTACDIACENPSRLGDISPVNAVLELMNEFDVTPDDCLRILWDNTRWPGHSRGVDLINRIAATRKEGGTVEADDDAQDEP